MTGGLRFRDTRTAKLKPLPASCKRRRVDVGIAVCRIPATVSVSQPLLVEVWPRIGDDFVDGSTLPASIDMTVLADTGNDADTVRAGAGDDRIVGMDGGDTIYGGDGIDRLEGMDGNDILERRRRRRLPAVQHRRRHRPGRPMPTRYGTARP